MVFINIKSILKIKVVNEWINPLGSYGDGMSLRGQILKIIMISSYLVRVYEILDRTEGNEASLCRLGGQCVRRVEYVLRVDHLLK